MHCDNRSSEWSAFVSTLCQENSLPLNLKGRKEKNAFFQKYVSKHPPAVSQRKIIASSSRNLLVNFPKFQIQSTLFKQNELIKIIQCISNFGDKATSDKLKEALLFWCATLKKATNDHIFHLLLEENSLSHGDTPCLFLATIQKIVELNDSIDILIPLLQNYNKQTLTLKNLSQILDEKKEEIDRKKYPEKSISEVYSDFLNSPFPLKKEELDCLFKQYEEVLSIEQSLKQSDLKEWVKEVAAIREQCYGKTISKKDLLTLVAIGRLAICYQFKIRPYNTQMITLLALLQYDPSLKGRIAEMKTGEGKSTVTALLAFVQASQGKAVDVVSSSRYLAERDAEKYAPFFLNFEIGVSHICTDDPKSDNFKGQIIYGTNYDFEFVLMRDQQGQSELRILNQNGQVVPRPFHVVIVDEVDNLFIDSALNSARIAIPSQATRAWIYPLILNFVKENQNQILLALLMAQYSSFLLLRPIIENLKNYLCNTDNGRYRQEIEGIDDEQFQIWLSSAFNAIFRYKKERDYVVKYQGKTLFGTEAQKKIVIVDWKNTGRFNEKSRWQNGLHEFLEAKNELPVQEESYTSASLCHPVYFGLYDKIFGLTGTLGTKFERCEVEEMYRIDSFDAPPHKKNVRQQLEPILVQTKEEHKRALLLEIDHLQIEGRPVLVLVETIEESKQFSELLQQKKVSHQFLNEMQPEDEDFVVARAGMPQMVTVATNTAGRGTDIVLDPDSRKNGGLHVIFAFFPENDRVELQGFGRAGRQGQLGSCRLILMTKKSKEQLYEERKNRVKALSKSRIQQVQLERVHWGYLRSFWGDLKRFYSLPHSEFTLERIQNWLKGVKEHLKEQEQIGLSILGALVQATSEPGSIAMGQELFGKKVQEILGNLAQQQWARLFYSKLARTKTEEEMECLFESSKLIWSRYLII